jgi:GTP 3',8-cyclase
LPRSLPLSTGPKLPPRSVRISLTDRCDLACLYCRPSRRDGYLPERLGLAHYRTLVDGLLATGVERVRFTGGEPLLSPHLVPLVAHTVAAGARDVSLTTNGTRLRELAAPLREAGLQRLTLSLDSLDPERFRSMTRGGDLSRVLSGLDIALQVGFDEIKLNVVVLRGHNEHELEALTRFAWQRGIVPRFIEVMPIAEGANLVPDLLVPAQEIWRALAPLLRTEPPLAEADRGPARYVASRDDPRLRVGVISGTTDTYCGTCDRLRVSADGKLRPCLATSDSVDVRPELDAGNASSLEAAVERAWAQKPDGRTFLGCTEDSAAQVSMRATGG